MIAALGQLLRPLLRRPLFVTVLIAAVVIAAWLGSLGVAGAGELLTEQWPVAVTMVFGSFIAGASSEGGGAVAFPVFTKVLQVAPPDAKLFALMIQSVGMTAASLTILAMRVRVDAAAIGLASIGGAVGVAVSLLTVAPFSPPAEVRVLFTAMQAGFACVLIMSLRRSGGRAAMARLVGSRDRIGLVATGFAGGIVSGLVGSGLDLLLFAVLTLRFGVSEKVATPTSVAVMAINSLVAVSFYRMAIGSPPPQVTAMWLAAIPVVVLGAPLGAWFCSRLRRTTIGWALVGLIAIEVTTTAVLIPHTLSTIGTGLSVSLVCVGVCFLMARRRWQAERAGSRELPQISTEPASSL